MLLHVCPLGGSWDSASVEATDWLSDFLLPSSSFFSLLSLLSVSLRPYLLLITGTSTGSPAFDLKAPAPRLKTYCHMCQGHRQFLCIQPKVSASKTKFNYLLQNDFRMFQLPCRKDTIPFTSITFTEFVVFSKEAISIITGDLFPWFYVPQDLDTSSVSTCGYKL